MNKAEMSTMTEPMLPVNVQASVIARQGRLHAHERLEGPRCALLVIDMQNYFCAPQFPAGHANARAIVPAINRMAEAVRSAGGRVIWIRTTAIDALKQWSRHHERMLSPERSSRRLAWLDPTHEGYQLFDGLRAEPTDLTIDKIMYSALIPGSSSLDSVLRELKIDTLLIAGTATHVCCESTARDAMMLDYGVVMLADANAASGPAAHDQALQRIALYFGDVMSVDQAVSRMEGPK
jgi:ureidoacrylate peracid hydrolase